MRNKNGGLRQIPVTALFSRKPRAFHPGHAVAPWPPPPASDLYPNRASIVENHSVKNLICFAADNRPPDLCQRFSAILFGSGRVHHVVHHDGIVANVGEREVQALAVELHHAKHLQRSVVLLQVAYRAVRQVQQHVAVAAIYFLEKLLHIGNQHDLKHVNLPF